MFLKCDVLFSKAFIAEFWYDFDEIIKLAFTRSELLRNTFIAVKPLVSQCNVITTFLNFCLLIATVINLFIMLHFINVNPTDKFCLQFEKGERNQAAVYAYTEFCSKYDQCGRLYDEWMLKNSELRKFFDVGQFG